MKKNERAGALASTPLVPTPAQIAQHVASSVYTQDKLPANLEALLARVDENNNTHNTAKKAIEEAMEQSKKEAKKDLIIIAANNVDFLKAQN